MKIGYFLEQIRGCLLVSTRVFLNNENIENTFALFISGQYLHEE